LANRRPGWAALGSLLWRHEFKITSMQRLRGFVRFKLDADLGSSLANSDNYTMVARPASYSTGSNSTQSTPCADSEAFVIAKVHGECQLSVQPKSRRH
jgi:hypothetical protein